MTTYLTLPGLNPVAWTAPSANHAQRRLYKAAELTAYQSAVREQLEAKVLLPFFGEGELDITFWFWRRLDLGVVMEGANRRGHQSDATNLQKALEDALQGVLFPNDRDTRHIQSTIVAQGPEVSPGIIIGLDYYVETPPTIPAGVLHDFRIQPVLGSNEHDGDVESVF